MYLLEAQGLRRLYGDRLAVKDFSATVEPGEIVVLAGPNGCGKTTSVEMCLGLRRSDHGTCRLLGHEPRRAPQAVRKTVGVVLQGAALHAKVRLAEQLQYLEALYGVPDAGARLTRDLGLDDALSRTYGALSGGMQRRALVATALVHSPQLAVLDEPTSGVDLESRLKLWAVLRGLVSERSSGVLVTSHDLLEAEHQADRVLIMKAGEIIASGSPADLVASSGVTTVVSVRTPGDVCLPAAEHTMLHNNGHEMTIGFKTEGDARAWGDSLSRECVTTTRPTNLEDVYLSLAGTLTPTSGKDDNA